MEANEPSSYQRREKLALQYGIKLLSLPKNPTNQCTTETTFADAYENRPNAIRPFSFRFHHLMDQINIDPHHINETKLSSIPPWELLAPIVNTELHVNKKDSVDPSDFHLHFYELVERYEGYSFVYTDGSKDNDKVGLGLTTKNRIYKERLPDRCSIYSAELSAIKRTLAFLFKHELKSAVICSDSLSALQAIEHLNIDHPIVQDILICNHILRKRGFCVIYYWVPGHMDMRK